MEIPAESVRRYLAENDHLCGCGYNLRGLREGYCPECGREISLPPDADAVEAARIRELVEFLRTHDIRCKHCGYNLRGMTTNRCPECNASYMLAGSTVAMTAGRRARASRTQRVRSVLILIAMGGSLLIFASMFYVASGLMRLSLLRGLGLLMPLAPWAVTLLWSLKMEHIENLEPSRREFLALTALLIAGGSLALYFPLMLL